LLITAFLIALPLQAATRPIWGRGATIFGRECPPAHPACTLAYVTSPNKELTIAAKLKDDVLTLTLADGMKTFDIKLSDDEFYWVDTEVLWSPDSSAFSLTGNPNGYTNQTQLYRVTSTGPQLVNISPIQREMGSTYPPCIGMTNPDVEFCNSIRDGSGYNYATFAWTSAHTAVIMAEVTPTGGYGKYLGQIRGYELDVSTGQIIRTMDARELKRRWQRCMAWKLRIPEKP
jgi:hypothetical protein